MQESTVEVINPSSVRQRWYHRHETSFSDSCYQDLKNSINASMGNSVAITVRSVAGDASEHIKYELVCGARRLRACRELQLPVRAVIIENLSDENAALNMLRENTCRNELSPFEQGQAYRSVLSLFKNKGELAKALHAPASDITRAIQCASLPPRVLNAFGCPTRIPYSEVSHLHRFFQGKAEGDLSKGELAIRLDVATEDSGKASAKNISEYITMRCDELIPAEPKELKSEGGGIVGHLHLGARSKLIFVGALTAESIELVVEACKTIKLHPGPALKGKGCSPG
ncbi:ParB/RepB/Spo0J family partition protein [Piscinibacter sakaiensis]|uniref:ParB/RepB/Spo0J family partition protein n=1 Tax=Piscinibacter sakaiensis TaxID=1547922 RepID=UPI003AAFD5D0